MRIWMKSQQTISKRSEREKSTMDDWRKKAAIDIRNDEKISCQGGPSLGESMTDMNKWCRRNETAHSASIKM